MAGVEAPRSERWHKAQSFWAYGVTGAQAVLTFVPKLPKEKPFVADISNAPAIARIQVNALFFINEYSPQFDFRLPPILSQLELMLRNRPLPAGIQLLIGDNLTEQAKKLREEHRHKSITGRWILIYKICHKRTGRASRSRGSPEVELEIENKHYNVACKTWAMAGNVYHY
ncbi:MAG: hypothetical protein ACYDBT_09685 [Desulfobulbaceae bacterium]